MLSLSHSFSRVLPSPPPSPSWTRSSRRPPCPPSPPCWRCAASPTFTGGSWWGPSSHYAATRAWWPASSQTPPGSPPTGSAGRECRGAGGLCMLVGMECRLTKLNMSGWIKKKHMSGVLAHLCFFSLTLFTIFSSFDAILCSLSLSLSLSLSSHLFSASIMPAMQRFGLGLLCLTIYAIFSPHYADSYFLTDEYEVSGCIADNVPVLSRCLSSYYCIIYWKSLFFCIISRPSLSGIAVCSSCYGPKWFSISMSAAGWLQ